MSEHEHPRGWFDPEWVHVERRTFGDDGTLTHSSGWVRREEWLRSESGEVTPDDLATALQQADEFPGHEMDWPYVDEFVIDGCLAPLVGWLCQHYVIVPRGTTTPPPNPSTTEGES